MGGGHSVKDTKPVGFFGTRHPVAHLMLWGRVLEEYAVDWDKTFDNRPSYFTQEYWYLLVRCTLAAVEGKPFTVSLAAQSMKSGSNRTRENRIQRAVMDGYLQKERSGQDARQVLLLPTDLLKEMILCHLDRTLDLARKELQKMARTPNSHTD